MEEDTSNYREVYLEDLGLASYSEVWAHQKSIQQELIKEVGRETLILCSHNPVITIGKSGDSTNLLASPERLKEQNVEFFEVERGGDITYHSPEQILLYPILSLRETERDVSKYMRNLEEVIIRTLSSFSIKSERNPGKTGVWIPEKDQKPIRKISSIGVKMSRWKTLHGVALNVHNCQTGFHLITPCGISGVTMTSMEEELNSKPDFSSVKKELIKNFAELFNCNFIK